MSGVKVEEKEQIEKNEKLIKLTSYKSKGEVYYKITLPKEFVEELGWKTGDVLIVKLHKNKLIIKRLGD